MIFTAYGHPNIRATHPTTLEFTKDAHLTTNGDCIVGIMANFSLQQLKKFLHSKKITITIQADKLMETITAVPNQSFSDNKELVIRTTPFTSPRTFATHADKSSKDIDRKLVALLKNSEQKITVTIK